MILVYCRRWVDSYMWVGLEGERKKIGATKEEDIAVIAEDMEKVVKAYPNYKNYATSRMKVVILK